MKVLTNLTQAIELLQQNEEYYSELFDLLSETDKKVDYWLHYIENETVPVTQAYKIIKEVKRLRGLRRLYKDELSLMKIFKDNEQKLGNASNRRILLTQVQKTNNKQQNAQYNYEAYTEEEINELLGIKKEAEDEKQDNITTCL